MDCMFYLSGSGHLTGRSIQLTSTGISVLRPGCPCPPGLSDPETDMVAHMTRVTTSSW